MKNLFIQKIIPNGKEVTNKPSLYLVTVNKGCKLEKVEILNKYDLLRYLENNLREYKLKRSYEKE